MRGPIPKFLESEKVLRVKKDLELNTTKSARQERLNFDTSLLKEVKVDLLNMCNNKCAYCESRVGVVSFGDVENFRPKAGARGFNSDEYAPMHYWWLAYEWDNLLISCQICNQKYKRDFFPVEDEKRRAKVGVKGNDLITEGALLIDPCLDNPAEHIEFDENGYVRELTKKGKVTIEILGLNRTDLAERRKTTSLELKQRLEMLKIISDSSSEFISALTAYIKELFSNNPSQEYAALQRIVFDDWYEQNATLWERVKIMHNDKSTTKRRAKRRIESSKVEEEIKMVDVQMTSLKRFSIESITIENFKSIDELTLNIMRGSEAEKESWLLLLGDNGIGKSSILQAIALALAGKKQLDNLRLDVLDYLRRGTESGRVVIKSYEHNNPITLHYDVNGFTTDLEEPPTFILGYGSTRLLPKGNIQSDPSKTPYLNIKNLFDYSVALRDPNIWLSRIDINEFNDRVAPAFFDVLALRGDDKLWVDNGKINLKQFGENAELEDNSDGYKTITALVTDIMQTLSIDKANYHNSQGIILVDEIGNHLHPRWRMKIVSALRKAFPKLQFIVTTHEPLCLRGLSHGEVVVLLRDEKNKVRALDKKLLPDHSVMRIEQLLTSDLFGLINVMDDEAEKTYDEYYRLLSKKDKDKTQDDKYRIEELSSKLSAKEILGATPQEQVLYTIIEETYAKNLREEGFRAKEQLKQETINQVKEMINKQNINWL